MKTFWLYATNIFWMLIVTMLYYDMKSVEESRDAWFKLCNRYSNKIFNVDRLIRQWFSDNSITTDMFSEYSTTRDVDDNI